jgi:hypothetical protein
VRRISSKEEPAEDPPPDDDDGPPVPPAARALPARAGLNRFAWDLRYADATRFKGLILWAGGTQGPRAAPGAYQVRLTAAGQTLTEPLELRKDPRLATTQAEFDEQSALSLQIRDLLTETHDAIWRLRSVRDQVGSVAERAKQKGADGKVQEAAEALRKKLTAVEEALYQTKNQSSQDPLNYPIRLNNRLAALSGTVAAGDNPPTAQAREVYQDLSTRIGSELKTLRELLATDLPAFNALVSEEKVPAVSVPAARK